MNITYEPVTLMVHITVKQPLAIDTAAGQKKKKKKKAELSLNVSLQDAPTTDT
jgi:hypothetical protein